MKRILGPIVAAAVALTALTAVAPARAQDKVMYRDRASKAVRTDSGKIDAETLAGIKLGSKTIPATDVIDVTYEMPGAVRIQYNAAVGNESKKVDDAIKDYEAVLKSSTVAGAKFIKRYLEYKVVTLKVAKADDGGTPAAAIDALTKFRKDNPDSWETVPATRLLARYLLDKEPSDTDGARKLYEELGASAAAPPELKHECALQAVDLLLQAKKPDEAKKKLAELPPADPRVRVYQLGFPTDKLDDAAAQLQSIINDTPDPTVKAAAYNALGDTYRRDPKHKKDALYSYLWVDVVYNQDPLETARAVDRLADLFKELKDDARAEAYRKKAKGR